MQNYAASLSSSPDCSGIVQHVYTHPDLSAVLSKIKPEAIQEDIRQEMAISLLEQPCDKISRLFSQNNLLRYAIRICFNMAVGNGTAQHQYSTTYTRKQLARALKFMYDTRPLPAVPTEIGHKAAELLNAKNKDKYDYHEQQIFWKYAELGTCRKVAQYFGIPKSHVQMVVKKVREELKNRLNDEEMRHSDLFLFTNGFIPETKNHPSTLEQQENDD